MGPSRRGTFLRCRRSTPSGKRSRMWRRRCSPRRGPASGGGGLDGTSSPVVHLAGGYCMSC